MNALPRIALAAGLCLTPPAAATAQLELPVTPEPQLRRVAGRTPGTLRWLVTLKAGRSGDVLDVASRRAAAVARARLLAPRVAALGGRLVESYWLVPVCLVELAPERVAELKRLPEVVTVHPDFWIEPAACLDRATNEANHDADSVHRLGIIGKGVAIAILDSGQDAALSGGSRPHRMYFVGGDPSNHSGGGIAGSRLLANVAAGKQPAEDPIGHGTAVAGAAAGAVWGASDGADDGHAPGAWLVGYGVSDTPSGASTTATAIRAWQLVVRDAKSYGIKVANFSYNGIPDPTHPSQQALDQAVLTADILVTVSAGNFAGSTAYSQAACNGLAVGAVHTNTRRVAVFSSRGPLSGDPQRTYPDLVANGVGVHLPKADDELQAFVTVGTSMAAPSVAGAAALYRSVRPQASALETKAAILATTEDISARNPKPPYNSPSAYGTGYLRDDALIALARGGGRILTGKLDAGTRMVSFPVTLAAGSRYVAALAWHRKVLTSKQWSDLSLEVKVASGRLAFADSRRNLYERVAFRTPTSGRVTIVVTAGSLGASIQEFAVAVAPETVPFTPGSVTGFGHGCGLSGGVRSPGLIVPPAFADKFGAYASPAIAGFRPHRYQQVFDPSLLPATMRITGLSFRLDEDVVFEGMRYWIEVEARLGEASSGPAGMSPVFAANQKGTQTVVFKKKTVDLPMARLANTSPGRFDFRLPFDRAYAYVKGGGAPLLLDVTRTRNSEGDRYGYYALDAVFAPTAPPVSAVISFSPTATSGFLSRGSGLVVGFVGGGGPAPRPWLSADDLPRVGSALPLVLGGVPPASPVLVFLGVSKTRWLSLPLPFDLTPFGAAGCRVLTDVTLLLAGASGPAGAFRLPLPLPKGAAWIGKPFYAQGMVLDPRANHLGLVSTNALELRAGGRR